MATKAAHTAFNRSVAAYLQSIGAEMREKLSFVSFSGEWILKTIAGDLWVYTREPERSEVFSIFCRFEDVEKAKQILWFNVFEWERINIHSGKWNFHSYDAKELLDEFKEQIAPLLIKTLTT